MHFVTFELAAIANEGRLGGQRKHLCFLTDPVVVHALSVLGVTHKARHIELTVNFPFVTDHAHDGYPFARPIALFQHLKTVSLEPFDLLAVHFARAQRLAKRRLHLLVERRVVEGRQVAGVKVERLALMLIVKILRDADRIF